MVVARWVPSALTRARLLTFFTRQPPRTLGVRSPQYLLIGDNTHRIGDISNCLITHATPATFYFQDARTMLPQQRPKRSRV